MGLLVAGRGRRRGNRKARNQQQKDQNALRSTLSRNRRILGVMRLELGMHETEGKGNEHMKLDGGN